MWRQSFPIQADVYPENVQAMAGLEDNPDFHHYFFVAEHDVIWFEASFLWIQVSFPCFNPSQPSSHSLQSEWEERESLDTLQALLSHSRNIGMVSTLFQTQIQTKHLMRKVNSIPSHPSCLDCSDGNYDERGGFWSSIHCRLQQD